MRIGATFKLRGQPYECTGSFEHDIPARCVTVFELYTRCPDCGRGFTATASASQIHKRQVNRRCHDCRSPGVPIKVAAKQQASAMKPARKTKRKVRRAMRKNLATGPQRAPTVAATARPGAIARLEPTAAVRAPGGDFLDPTSHAATVDAYAELLGFID